MQREMQRDKKRERDRIRALTYAVSPVRYDGGDAYDMHDRHARLQREEAPGRRPSDVREPAPEAEIEENGGEGHGWQVEERGASGLKGTPQNPATRTPRAARKYQWAWRCEGACGLRTGGGNRYARRGERSRNPWGRSWMEASHGATWS